MWKERRKKILITSRHVTEFHQYKSSVLTVSFDLSLARFPPERSESMDSEPHQPSFSASVSTSSSVSDSDASISDVRRKQQLDVENLSLTTDPYQTLKLFFSALIFYLRKSLSYVLRNCGWILGMTIIAYASWTFLIVNILSEEDIQESLHYLRFGLWWISLGVASSIGLGAGFHTFVLYLGPHIALFTIKSMECGRIDFKATPYDTIQMNKAPSWIEKDCLDFGPSLFPKMPNSLVRVPFESILPQIQLEAVLWGFGTALGELPPYFISRAARISGSELDAVEGLNVSSSSSSSMVDGSTPSTMDRLKIWLFNHSQYLNFFTIFLLASVPNPLFDLAGIICGQFGIPFWKFFLATMIGKAVIKTHLQSIFVIALCNNQLLELVENELIWVLKHTPGLSLMVPGIIIRLHKIKETYLSSQISNVSYVKDKKQWKLSFNLIWNSVLWLMFIHFFGTIITSIAKTHLKRQHEIANWKRGI
ncbi:putative Vacuole membrane protein [Zostera marina]|uniref:Putative Vacuole membrane protein n=1 Tax=Zostera marina TaxID=29655 RepID=A0A0K9Q5N6_ZOSMR|nr:putative Vacuole membrane protein [Zostera marina]